MLEKIVAFISIGASGLLFIILSTTSPVTAGPLVILLVFILMYLSALGALTFLIYRGRQAFIKLVNYTNSRKVITQWGVGRSYYYSSVVALGPVIFIGMMSVGEVGIYDVLLIVLFITIACIYITKRTH